MSSAVIQLQFSYKIKKEYSNTLREETVTKETLTNGVSGVFS